MHVTRKIAWLWIACLTSACQALPIPNPLHILSATPANTPGPTPTNTPFPTSTPLPTMEPVVRIDTGDQALFFGDYDLAREQYQTAFNDTTDNAIKAAALWGLGRTNLADGRYQESLDALNNLVNNYSDSTYAARAYFLMGQDYYGLKQYQPAADAYNTYMTRVPGVLDGYVQEYRGDALNEAGDFTGAQNAYNAALAAPRLDDGLNLQIKVSETHASFGDYAGALTLYDKIFASSSSNDYVKAQMDYYAGNAYVKLGQTEQANARYLHAVQNYPLSYYAYLSLVELVNANVDVDDMARGLVDYYASQYDVALVAFDRYIAANPVNDGTVHYYRALTLRDLQRTQDAIDEFDTFLKAAPDHPKAVDAWEEKAFLQWAAQDNYDAAVQTLLEFVSTYPASPSAADFLMNAGRVLERNNKLSEAAQTWGRIADEYSDNEQVPDALFLAGIAHYRLNDYSGARTTLDRDLLLSTKPEDRARALFWIGKIQQHQGDNASAQASWQQSQAADASNYYGLRSIDMLLGRASFATPATTNLNPDLSQERKDAEAWVRVKFGLPPETDLTGPGPLAQDPRFVRGTELWELGMYDEARAEFESVRDSVSTDAVASFRLANHLLEIGLYRSAIFAARQVLTLAGLDTQQASLSAPAYFNHLRYGLYYHDLIIAESQRYGIDPLFMFSVIRQESLFEGFVRSTAGAHGLMQIIPDTGQQIANELNWPPAYDAEDLYRPIVSVRFGAYYLAKNRDLLNGNWYAGLAAYNAGPGNAIAWRDLAGNDPDLLLEVIRFQETRDYIRLIYEIFSTYRSLYGPAS